MRFDVTNDDIDAAGQFTPSRLQHGVCFANARRHAKKDLQPAAALARLFMLKGAQQSVRVRARIAHKTDGIV